MHYFAHWQETRLSNAAIHSSQVADSGSAASSSMTGTGYARRCLRFRRLSTRSLCFVICDLTLSRALFKKHPDFRRDPLSLRRRDLREDHFCVCAIPPEITPPPLQHDLRRHGEEVRLSCDEVAGRRITTKTEARALLRAEWQKAQTPNLIESDQRKVTVGALVADLLQHYEAHGQKLRHRDCEAHWWLHLCQTFDAMRAVDLGTGVLNDYRSRRRSEGAAQATVNRELQTLRHSHKLAAESEPPKVARVPRFNLPAEKNARQRFNDAAEVERLQRAARGHSLWATVFVEMLRLYGWRRGELLSLRVGDVNLADRCVRLLASKTATPARFRSQRGCSRSSSSSSWAGTCASHCSRGSGMCGRRGRPSRRRLACRMLTCTTGGAPARGINERRASAIACDGVAGLEVTGHVAPLCHLWTALTS
jgi:hypothetical protein